MPARTRLEMAQMLEGVMNSAYESLVRGQRLEKETSLVKSYLVEAHAAYYQQPDSMRGAIRDLFGPTISRLRIQGSFLETDEEGFFMFAGDAQGHALELFVDATNPRFWVVHSTSKSRS